jgi:hypothetical protein
MAPAAGAALAQQHRVILKRYTIHGRSAFSISVYSPMMSRLSDSAKHRMAFL